MPNAKDQTPTQGETVYFNTNIKTPTQEELNKAKAAMHNHVQHSFKSGETVDLPPELLNYFEAVNGEMHAKLQDIGGNFFATAIVDVINSILGTFARVAIAIGYAMSGEELAREYGRQEANKDAPITLLSPGEVIEAWFRGLADESMVDDQLGREGIEASKRDILKKLAHELLSAGDLAVLANRGKLTDDEYKQYLSMRGFRTQDFDYLDNLRQSFLSAAEARAAWFKGIITESEFIELLSYEGYSQDQALKFLAVAWEYPSPVESLINARHGAFDDSIAARWGLDYEISGKWLDWMQKNGYSEEVARSYWRGHWAPATNGELLQMYRRRYINTDMLSEGLTLNGVAQGWHDMLANNAFEVPSYFVIEAMVGNGQPDVQKVTDWCKLAGYSDEFAVQIAEGFIKKYGQTSAGKLMSQIKQSASVGGLTNSQAYNAFLDIGLTEDEATLEMQIIQVEIEQATAKKQITLVQNQYVEGTMSKSDAVKQLILFGVGTQEIDHWMLQWDLEKQAKVKTLTSSQVGDSLKYGFISSNDAKTRWKNMGYNDVDADLLDKLYTRGK